MTGAEFPGPITAALPVRPAGADRRTRERRSSASELPKAQPPAIRERHSRPQGVATVLPAEDDDGHLIDDYG